MADEQTPKWRGVKVVGGDLRISDLKITFDDDGNITTGPVRTQIRTDLWPFWLEDAVEAAATACSLADQIPALDALLDTDVPKEPINAEIDRLLFRELRASMRAITACAFAIDAFYAWSKSDVALIHTTAFGGRTERRVSVRSLKRSGITSESSQKALGK
jgi:hypothetical protein